MLPPKTTPSPFQGEGWGEGASEQLHREPRRTRISDRSIRAWSGSVTTNPCRDRGLAAWTKSTSSEDGSMFYPEVLRNGALSRRMTYRARVTVARSDREHQMIPEQGQVDHFRTLVA